MNHARRGSGGPLLLVHGLGAGWQCWSPLIDELAESREVIAVDLPDFGESPPLTGEVSIATLTGGRRDRVTVPRQAARATGLFPDAVLHRFDRCGHFPPWDAPHEATRLILDSTS